MMSARTKKILDMAKEEKACRKNEGLSSPKNDTSTANDGENNNLLIQHDPVKSVVPTLSLLCKKIVEGAGNLPCQSNINESENSDSNEASGQAPHITADFMEQLQRTPVRDEEFSDYDNDDDVADPNYLSVEENDDDPSPDEENNKQQCRKRRSNPANWKKNVTRKKRHSGLEYTTDNGCRVMAQQSVKEPCNDTCKLSCKTKISEDARQIIHKNFWSPTKSIDVRRQFIASRVVQIPIQRNRERTGERRGKRTFTNSYSFEVRGVKQTVCKKFFLSTLSISQQTVDTAIKKKKDGGIVTPDKRGKHEPSNKIAEEVRNSVRSHISKFPTYESHYSRERTKKRYLGNTLNVSKMFSLYLEDCRDSGLRPENIAKEWLYSEIFNYEFNYSFKNPDNDTCDLCDQYKLQLQEAESAENRAILQKKYDEHLLDASNRYKMKANDKQKSRERLLQEKVIMIDLQKCLPTPDLHNSQSFYSLKLWTYNLTIHDSSLEKSFCVMWDESVAGRGGNEVASCLVKWLQTNVSDGIEELTLWSDNCPSQNRNILMIMCYFWMLHINPTIKVINHKYLARGHTHQEADAVHSVIERERKKVPQFQIITPWDWQQLVRLSGTRKHFTVINMETSDFKDFKQLFDGQTAPYINKKKDTEGGDFLISQALHLQVRKDNPGVLYYKSDFSEEFSEVDFNRRSRRGACMPAYIPPIREDSKPISDKKYNHLQKLLPWVPKRFHSYYKDLKHGNNDDDD